MFHLGLVRSTWSGCLIVTSELLLHKGKLLSFKLLWLKEDPHHITLFFFSEGVSQGILRSLCAFPTGVTFPCNVTMEDYVLKLEILLSQDLGSNNFLKNFQQ